MPAPKVPGFTAGKTPEHKVWLAMKQRCRNPNNKRYRLYGGRGIKVCERWESSFENFLADLGFRPSPKHSLERTDRNGNYCPENCIWATIDKQNRNTSRNRFIEYDGKNLTLSEWDRELGFKPGTVSSRLLRGWGEIDSVTLPRLYLRGESMIRLSTLLARRDNFQSLG